MLKYLRYALATFCFAASVGCLGLWWRSYELWEILGGPTHVVQEQTLSFQSFSGTVLVMDLSEQTGTSVWTYISMGHPKSRPEWKGRGSFGSHQGCIYFPLWYPALIFALAGVAVLRLGRRFTLRSALIVTTVVAVLLGMAVIL